MIGDFSGFDAGQKCAILNLIDYKMARNIAGTLLYLGSEKIELEMVPEIFKKNLRKNVGTCALAKGFFT